MNIPRPLNLSFCKNFHSMQSKVGLGLVKESFQIHNPPFRAGKGPGFGSAQEDPGAGRRHGDHDPEA